jgi:hypothetical protein
MTPTRGVPPLNSEFHTPPPISYRG